MEISAAAYLALLGAIVWGALFLASRFGEHQIGKHRDATHTSVREGHIAPRTYEDLQALWNGYRGGVTAGRLVLDLRGHRREAGNDANESSASEASQSKVEPQSS